MSAVFVVVLMILIAGLPVVAGSWYFRAKHAVSMRVFLAAMSAGIVTVLLAIGAQLLIARLSPEPTLQSGTKWVILYKIFIEIASTEELARVLMLALFTRLLTKPIEEDPHNRTALLRTFGMIAGFSFAAVETIFFTMTNLDSGLVRAISAAPLHGACGIRAGNAVLYGKRSIGLSLLSLFFAIALHGIYNFLAQRGGYFSYMGVALAVTAFLSGAQSIRFEKNDTEENGLLSANKQE
jgi:hypothetical protein